MDDEGAFIDRSYEPLVRHLKAWDRTGVDEPDRPMQKLARELARGQKPIRLRKKWAVDGDPYKHLNELIPVQVLLPGYLVVEAIEQGEGDLDRGIRRMCRECVVCKGNKWWYPRYLIQSL